MILWALCLVFLLLNFGLFAWAIQKFFKAPEGGLPREMRQLSLLGSALALIQVLSLFLNQKRDEVLLSIGLGLLLASLGLFLWALRVNQKHPLPIAFSGDQPQGIQQRGPYRWVRHPFYLSYLLTWATAPFVSQWVVLAAIPIVMAAIYHRMAVSEEKFLLSGPHGSDYQAYQSRTGRLLPWLG
jgi:protein-S-isoprenylcysteine O-methyltransferase Ste14